MTNEKPMVTVLCRVPPMMFAAMDQAASELRLTRSSFVREAIHARLARYEREERELILILRQQTEAAYGSYEPKDDQ
jgi:predicted transcriptional regulator